MARSAAPWRAGALTLLLLTATQAGKTNVTLVSYSMVGIDDAEHMWDVQVFAVNRINADPKILPNHNLILLRSDYTTADAVIQLNVGHMQQTDPYISGFIGLTYASTTNLMAVTTKAWQRPLLGISASNNNLRPRLKAGWFGRVCNSQGKQAQVYVEAFVRQLRWFSAVMLRQDWGTQFRDEVTLMGAVIAGY